jgi:hypothetical protein
MQIDLLQAASLSYPHLLTDTLARELARTCKEVRASLHGRYEHLHATHINLCYNTNLLSILHNFMTHHLI